MKGCQKQQKFSTQILIGRLQHDFSLPLGRIHELWEKGLNNWIDVPIQTRTFLYVDILNFIFCQFSETQVAHVTDHNLFTFFFTSGCPAFFLNNAWCWCWKKLMNQQKLKGYVVANLGFPANIIPSCWLPLSELFVELFSICEEKELHILWKSELKWFWASSTQKSCRLFWAGGQTAVAMALCLDHLLGNRSCWRLFR